MPRRHRQEIGRPLPLLPERSADARATPREEQRAGGVLAELGGEEGGPPELPQHQRLHLVGPGEQELDVGRRSPVREADHDAVVGPHCLHVEAEQVADPGGDGHRPRRMHPPAQRREDADSPVAQLVTGPFDDQRLVVGHLGRRLGLVVEVTKEVRRPRWGRAGAPEPDEPGRLPGERAELADEAADHLPRLQRPRRRIAVPEGHLSRLPGGGRDQHPVVGDLLDAPRRGAEEEHLADLALEHHLLVELADPGLLLLGACKEDAVEAAVRDGAAVDDGDALGAIPRDDRVGHPVPRQPGPQLGEVVRGVAAGEQVEEVVEDRPAQLGVGSGPAHGGVERVDVPGLDSGHRHQLLGEDVEWIPRGPGRLHPPARTSPRPAPRRPGGPPGTWGR